MKQNKKQAKEAQYILKLWGLQLPMKQPLEPKDVKMLVLAFLLFLLLLAKRDALISGASITGHKVVESIAAKIGSMSSRSP